MCGCKRGKVVVLGIELLQLESIIVEAGELVYSLLLPPANGLLEAIPNSLQLQQLALHQLCFVLAIDSKDFLPSLAIRGLARRLIVTVLLAAAAAAKSARLLGDQVGGALLQLMRQIGELSGPLLHSIFEFGARLISALVFVSRQNSKHDTGRSKKARLRTLQRHPDDRFDFGSILWPPWYAHNPPQ
jgi:hypothetical protein